MIFGATYEQVDAADQAILKQIYENPYEKRFAWIPKQCVDGRYIWLQTYYIKRDIGLGKNDRRYYDNGYKKGGWNKKVVYLTKE